MQATTRRAFMRAGALVAGAVCAGPLWAAEDTAPRRKYRAAIIGHTGHGDYGHGYDQIFNGLEQVSVDALADPDATGRRQAAERCGARRTYADYRELLAKERPDLVSIAMRHPRAHREVALAALEAGAHLFMEKPFTETLLEADSVVAAAEKRGLKIVVAHNRRYTADFVRVKALLAEGFAGQVREVRIQGKQDSRVGGEDMVVLGTHDFDLLRFYFGDPLWCLGTVTQAGRDVTKQDARQGQEPIVVAGDTIRTHFAFSDGVYAHWSSVKTREGWSRPADRRDHWAFELLGTKRIVAYQSGAGFACLDSPYLLHPDNAARWQPLPEPKSATPEHQKHMARDLIHALETHSAPLCGAADGRWTLEMLTAVYQSHFARARVAFPLASRQNPLA